MMQRLLQDVLTIRKRAGPLPVVLLADGAQELWKLFSEHLNESTLSVEPRTGYGLCCPRYRCHVRTEGDKGSAG